MPRTFRARPDRTLTLPRDLAPGPGASNLRLDPGAIVTVEDDRAQRYQRFLANRVAVGDLEEVDPMTVPADAPAPKPVASINAPSSKLGIIAPAIPEKG
jgi:hypothetical protein